MASMLPRRKMALLTLIYVKSLFDIALGRSSGWNTVHREKVRL